MTKTASLAANTSTVNIFAGELEELLRRGGMVTLSGTGSAIGLNVTFMVGGRVIVNDQPISLANRWPVLPDDYIAQEAGRMNERVYCSLRNTTVGALTYYIACDVDYI